VSQCHARYVVNPRERCELDGGHEGNHEVRTTWTEDECFDPAVFEVVQKGLEDEAALVLAPPPPLSGAILPLASFEDNDATDGSPDQCFSCGCPEYAHGRATGCADHACRTFVP
jgi:hypothetical protein